MPSRRSSIISTPVSVMETAGEGGAWGIALLAQYMAEGADCSLANWLDDEVFADAKGETLAPDPVDVKGFDEYIARYRSGLDVEKEAVRCWKN